MTIFQLIDDKITHEFKFKNAFIERIGTKFSENNVNRKGNSPYEKIKIKIKIKIKKQYLSIKWNITKRY
ncbi:hypothetical protein EAE91_03220 [Photorhabdus noenieputensis]|uniref:hypothetical protein n=1 Tax=Photorhabdus noenieputensis TaxID=1208607 RepID=UPI001BD524D5|nr:hypothetical protein [Photorhabdus noenieputensis]MBS9436223.1 hypothetical protein [Photorhabdus noenieputensis]MCK3669103.1 hypothetical protein [Photorhabdus noenieputensis]